MYAKHALVNASWFSLFWAQDLLPLRMRIAKGIKGPTIRNRKFNVMHPPNLLKIVLLLDGKGP